MKISKDSWIYRLAYTYGFAEPWGNTTDICSLTKDCIRGLFLVVACIFFGSYLSYALGDFILSMYFWTTIGYIEFGIGIAFFSMVAFFAVAGLAWFLIALASDKYPVLNQMVDSHRNKYCVKVEIE
jgi:accessory gene regulator protein AgrB